MACTRSVVWVSPRTSLSPCGITTTVRRPGIKRTSLPPTASVRFNKSMIGEAIALLKRRPGRAPLGKTAYLVRGFRGRFSKPGGGQHAVFLEPRPRKAQRMTYREQARLELDAIARARTDPTFGLQWLLGVEHGRQ